MGYTNYYTLKRTVDKETWAKIIKDCKVLYKNMPEYADEEPISTWYKDNGIRLYLNGCGGYKLPQFTAKQIFFNGGGHHPESRRKVEDRWEDTSQPRTSEGDMVDLSHETFYMYPKVKKGVQSYEAGSGFGFCKTARKPYDLMVKAVLIVCKVHLEDYIEIDCDGEDEDWHSAIRFVTNVLGEKYLSPDVMELLIA